jgi:hypothetical protein
MDGQATEGQTAVCTGQARVGQGIFTEIHGCATLGSQITMCEGHCMICEGHWMTVWQGCATLGKQITTCDGQFCTTTLG